GTVVKARAKQTKSSYENYDLITERIFKERVEEITPGEFVATSLIDYPFANLIMFGIPVVYDAFVFPLESLFSMSFSKGLKSTAFYSLMDVKKYEQTVRREEISRKTMRNHLSNDDGGWENQHFKGIPVLINSTDFLTPRGVIE